MDTPCHINDVHYIIGHITLISLINFHPTEHALGLESYTQVYRNH